MLHAFARCVADLAAEGTIADFKCEIRAFGSRDAHQSLGLENLSSPFMTSRKFCGIRIERCEVHVIDEILRRQFGKANRIRSALPMKMHGASPAGIEPFIQGLGESRAAALVDFR